MGEEGSVLYISKIPTAVAFSRGFNQVALADFIDPTKKASDTRWPSSQFEIYDVNDNTVDDNTVDDNTVIE